MVRDRSERGIEAGDGAGTTPIQSPLFESKMLTKKAGEGGAGEGGGAGAALTRSTVDMTGKYRLIQRRMSVSVAIIQ